MHTDLLVKKWIFFSIEQHHKSSIQKIENLIHVNLQLMLLAIIQYFTVNRGKVIGNRTYTWNIRIFLFFFMRKIWWATYWTWYSYRQLNWKMIWKYHVYYKRDLSHALLKLPIPTRGSTPLLSSLSGTARMGTKWNHAIPHVKIFWDKGAQ